MGSARGGTRREAKACAVGWVGYGGGMTKEDGANSGF